MSTTPRLTWRRKYLHPLGQVIGFYDVAYPEVDGRLYEIRRFWGAARVKFYVPHGFTNGKGDCLRFRTLTKCISWLRDNTHSVPCT